MLQHSLRKHRLLAAVLITLTGCGAFSPKNEAAFLTRGRQLLAEKDYSRALLEFRNAAKVAPKDAEPHYQLGLTYLQSGDYPAAILALRHCLELDPRHSGAQLKSSEMMTSKLFSVCISNPANTSSRKSMRLYTEIITVALGESECIRRQK